MNKTKLAVAGVVAGGLALTVYWLALDPVGVPIVGRPSQISRASRDGMATSASHAHASDAAATTPATPDWETRLQQIASRVGHATQAELDHEIEDLARDLPDAEMLVVLNLQLLPDTEKMPFVSTLCALLVKRWAERAPGEAAAWVARLPQNRFSVAAHEKVGAAWAAKDVAAAAAWVQQLPAGESRLGAQYVVATEAANHKETTTALTLATGLPAGPQRDRLINYSVLQWATVDRERAAAWAEQFPDAGVRADLLSKIAVEWGIEDPARAAAFAARNVPAGPGQETALVKIARFWATSAPAQAAAWVEQFPESPLRDAMSQSVIEVWARDDSVRAADWLQRLPAGRARDEVVGAFASVIAEYAPAKLPHAAGLAQTIQNEQLRTSVLARLRGP